MPRREYNFWVYILASRSHQLYVGLTNSVSRRMDEHRAGQPGAYTAKYNINRLVYFEYHQYILNAIAREKELKDMSRAEKIALIESVNPTWQDLSSDWGESSRRFLRSAAE
jgi:putative endonuclease